MPRRAKIWKNEASGDPDGPPGRKMGCRGVPTSKKLEKQRFGMPRRPKPQKLAGRKTALALPFQLRNVYLLSHLEICNAGVDGLDITIHSRP